MTGVVVDPQLKHDVVGVELEDVDCRGNRAFWSGYDWSRGGEEWSAAWGTGRSLWYSVLLPRLGAYLPAGRVLEIGPGYGRISEYLRGWCRELTLVDLTPRCVEACRKRFAGDEGVRCIENDGRSLAMLPEGGTDLAFSWETLVSVERSTVRAYLDGLKRVLRPGGVGVLHHSNLGEHGAEFSQQAGAPGGRRLSQTAAGFAADCREAGLRCVSQELLLSRPYWMDAISVVLNDLGPGAGADPRVIRNAEWGEEARRAALIAGAYPVIAPTM